MRFNTKELLTAVTKVKAFCAKRAALPILTGIRLTAIGSNAVTLEGTDLEAGIITTVEAEGNPFEPIVIEAKSLYDALRRKDNFSVTEIGAEAVKAGASTLKLKQWPADDYPTLPMPEEADNLTQLKGNIEDLLAALPRLAIAASKDDTRPLLGGIAVEFDEDRDALDLVATDTYRLAVYRSTVNAFQGKVIWPARCVTNIAKVLGHSPVVHVGGRHSYFASARMLCFVRNIEGQYVKWRPLFHNGDGWSWSFDPKVEHPNMVAMAKATPHLPVRFDFSAGTEQTTSQEGIGVQGKMSGTFTETDLKLGLNPTYFAEAMQIVGGDEVVARGIDNLKPVILTGEPRWEVLQMPI